MEQLILFFDDYSENYPSEIRTYNLIDGSCFKNYYPISEIKMRAPPGTKFYINHSPLPCIVGVTGVFDLKFLNQEQIISLNFDEVSIKRINNEKGWFLFVDIKYNKGG